MAVKQLSYTTEQVDDAISKKDLLKDVSIVNASPSDVADVAKYVDINGVHAGTLKTLKEKTYNFTTEKQTIPAGSMLIGDQTINKISAQSKTVSIDTAEQIITPDKDKVLTRVVVNKLPTDAIGSDFVEIPEQVVTPTVYDIDLVGEEDIGKKYLRNNKVTIKGDANLKSENIKLNTTIFGVTGSYEKDPNMEYPANDGKDFKTYGLVGTHSWSSVCYGNGKFVAVAQDTKTAAYSMDGINWTIVPTNIGCSYVCYGNGKFVAVQYVGSDSMMSTDGINWTYSSLPQEANWRSVCYGNGKFVAVAGNSDFAAYSANGITWEVSYMSTKSNWRSVCYGNGKFVAITYNSEYLMNYSTDGINWTEGKLSGSDDDFYSVCYGNETFVAIVGTGSSCCYSTDGINWNRGSIPYAYWQSVCFGNGRFVAVSNPSGDYNKAMYSTDGISWTSVNISTSASWANVCYGDDKYVAVGHNSNYGIESTYSEDGSVWNQINTINGTVAWKNITYGDHKYVAIASGSTITATKANLISYSYDSINWTSATITGNIAWKDVIYGSGKFIAIGDNTNSISTNNLNTSPIAYSYDGINWNQLSVELPAESPINLKSISYGNGKFVVIGDKICMYSTDGINWINSSIYLEGWEHVCYGGNKFVAAGPDIIGYSTDSVNWIQITMPLVMSISSICYGNGKFVAIGYDSTDYSIVVAAYSSDGINWAANSNIISTTDIKSITLVDVNYGNGKFIAIGKTDAAPIIIYSTDTINWSIGKVNCDCTLTCVKHFPGKFIIIGNTPVNIILSNTTNDVSQTIPEALPAPVTTVQGSALVITPVTNATGYEIYAISNKEALKIYTDTLRVVLSDYLTETGAYTILTRACGNRFIKSPTYSANYVIS